MGAALEATKRGAYRYTSKPFKTGEVLLTIRKGGQRGRLGAGDIVLREELGRIRRRWSFAGITPRSEETARAFETAPCGRDLREQPADAPLQGKESGY